MKKGLSLTLTAALAASALTPVAASAATPQAQNGFYNITTGEFYTSTAFKALPKAQQKAIVKNADFYIVSAGKVFKGMDLVTKTSEQLKTAATSQEAFQNEKNVTLTPDGKVLDKEGNVVGEKPVTGDLKVESVSAINNTGVTVTFPALKADALGTTVEVKDATGTVYAVKSADIAEGKTSHEFEFVTTVADSKLVGTWTVDGKSFDLDLSTNLKAFNDAGTDQIKLNKALNDLGIKNVKVENVKAYADAQPEFLAKLATDKEDLSKANIQAFVDKVNSESITAGESKVIAKKVTDAKDAGNDVALLQALKDPAFKRVNSEWLTEYKSGIVVLTDDTVEKIQAKINAANTSKVGLATSTGIVKQDLIEAKDQVTLYNTPDSKGEMTATTKTKLDAINIQLALVDVLEATTPNNFKAKLTSLAGLVNTPGSTVIDMKNYVDGNGQAYIARLAGEATAAKDTAAEVSGLLFDATTGVNDVEAGKLITAVKTKATAAKADDTNATKQAELMKALKDLGIKQVELENKAAYSKDAATNVDLIITASTTTPSKAKVQVAVDQINLNTVGAQTTNTAILEKLSVFGLDNVIAANAAQYVLDKSAISGVTPDAADNAETVKLVKAQIAISNNKVVVAAQETALNNATTVAEVKTALDALANAGEVAGYLTVRSADREFVAAHVLENRPVNGYTNAAAIQTEIGATDAAGARLALKDSLTAVNAITYASSPDAVVTALKTTLDEEFLAMTPVQQSATAQAFQNKLVFDTDGTLKVDFVTLAAVKALLK